LASKPEEYSWRQLVGAGALAGIGFTMSLFIATQALPDSSDFAAAKIAVFGGSILSAVVAVAILWNADRQTERAVTAPETMHAADESRRQAHQVTLQGSA
jgi:Na+:H+ antiporter, NhaA family